MCFPLILSVLSHILVFTKSSYGVWILHTQLFIPVLPDFTTSALRSTPAGLCASPASASFPLRPDLRQLLRRIKSGLLNKYSSTALRQGPGAGSISGAPPAESEPSLGRGKGEGPCVIGWATEALHQDHHKKELLISCPYEFQIKRMVPFIRTKCIVWAMQSFWPFSPWQGK